MNNNSWFLQINPSTSDFVCNVGDDLSVRPVNLYAELSLLQLFLRAWPQMVTQNLIKKKNNVNLWPKYTLI